MSFTLFKADVKANRFIWLLITIIYSFYAVIIVSMFDPENADTMAEMMEMMPQELLDAGGITFGSTLLTHISGFLYSMLLYLFPLIITVIVNHQLIASHVDKGSMAYLLSTSNSRTKIAVTQAMFSILSITLVFTVITIVQIIVSVSMFPGELEVGQFILLNVYAMLLYYAISGICFFASCTSNEARYSLGLGAGLPIAFIVLEMLGNTGENVSWLGNLSIFALFDPDRLFAGDTFAYIGMTVLGSIAVVLYAGGIALFKKRDLPL
ncbi:ABC transporter permease subunit [Natribacillus halophilus]|uniref:ABC-2 type transport system permease protein n=1 Tax=Natribacillus halophilus TaxID=549003 RepID=A0A1G8Q0W9_9BACI|nr:ABC transporter permease subunit [Natribacillus halophilus]SDI97740.1 ABC-2 type transport system permease protein [Natribacillus halophilus]